MLDGWHGDTSRMFFVGNVPIKAKRLVDVTYECLMLGIEQAKPGNHIGDIGAAIQKHAEKHRYGVVRDFCGHGLGRLFHDAPEIVHAAPRRNRPRNPPRNVLHHRANDQYRQTGWQGARRWLDSSNAWIGA